MENRDQPGLPLPFVPRFTAAGEARPLQVSSRRAESLYVVACSDNRAERVFKRALESAPLIHVHELVSALLARVAGFPVLNPCIIDVGNKSWFGIDYLTGQQKLEYELAGTTFNTAINSKDVVYQAICLDAWLLNSDRHDGNIVLRLEKRKRKNVWVAYLIDHDMAIGASLDESMATERLRRFAKDFAHWTPRTTAWIHPEATWVRRITSWAKVQEVAEHIQGIDEPSVDAVFGAIPDDWVSAAYKGEMRKFVLARQLSLRAILDYHRDKLSWVHGR